MAKWIYTIESGVELREAINDGNIEQVVFHLSQCYHELIDKLSEEDKEWKRYDIEDAIEFLEGSEDMDEEDINWYLGEFYDICDDLRAFVALD